MKNIKEDEKLNVINHSCAHLLAHAVSNLYPQAKFWVGPVIEEGFYYDIDLSKEVIKEEDLSKIEREMKRIAKDGKKIIRREITKEEALKEFSNDPYKIDLINQMQDEVISCYNQGTFTDLCRGPHVETVKELKHFKLLKTSGAYWKGDSKNQMLQRIYGICFESAEDLESHLNLIEEAKKRDHRKLGKELELFMINDFAPGMPFFLPNGMIIRNILESFWYEEHIKEGYTFIKTPILLDKKLWEYSGHWDNYKENMYITNIDEAVFAVKPMNCPGGMLVYKNGLHSYKDMPIRSGELGLVHRHEASGALSGLFRVRQFTQDDAHIFMREDQVEDEIIRLINFIDRIYSVFGFDYRIELSTRPDDKFIGEIDVWNKSEKILEEICKKTGKEFKINPGDGAFYGPKLDFHIKDAIGRSWQCGTIQLDMNLTERFDLTYIDSDGTKKRPVMVHRVIFGSIERFFGILIEHFAGAFPLWLSSVQINVIPVNNQYHLEYAKSLKEELINHNMRVTIDDREEKLSYKIRESQTKKIPLTIVVGDKEKEEQTLTYRIYGQEKSYTTSISDFIYKVKENINNKSKKFD
ncbi:MAG: threonine--tRNA ligase [Bacilli bacterium]|nr:threonine--tRNA ligase [Bacilli bacterium]